MRRVIKSVLSIAIAVTVTAGVCLTSYAGWWNSGNSATTAAAAATATTETFSFVSGTTTINVGDKAQDIIKALGQCKSVYEVPSCAYQGNDKIYAYDGFEISTYMKNSVETVNGVFLINKTCATKEGIKIGDSVKTLTNVYGKDYKLDNGVYRYTKGDSVLSFYTTANAVTDIEYTLTIK